MTPPLHTLAREDVLHPFTATARTVPDRIPWPPLPGIPGNTLRLRTNIPQASHGHELSGAASTLRSPNVDPPEVRRLIPVLHAAGAGAEVPYRPEAPPHELQTGMVGFFEPYKIRLPFVRATLEMVIAPQEFQWILKNAGKEPAPWSERLPEFRRLIEIGTREWLRNGNR